MNVFQIKNNPRVGIFLLSLYGFYGKTPILNGVNLINNYVQFNQVSTVLILEFTSSSSYVEKFL
jgi:hypothetical protein